MKVCSRIEWCCAPIKSESWHSEYDDIYCPGCGKLIREGKKIYGSGVGDTKPDWGWVFLVLIFMVGFGYFFTHVINQPSILPLYIYHRLP